MNHLPNIHDVAAWQRWALEIEHAQTPKFDRLRSPNRAARRASAADSKRVGANDDRALTDRRRAFLDE